jgi:hypothetical protein
MTTSSHAILWIASGDARIIYVAPDAQGPALAGPAHQIRSKPDRDRGNPAIQRHMFFQAVANRLERIDTFVVTGRPPAPTDFVWHVRQFEPQLTRRLLVADSLDDPTDDHLTALAHRHFGQFWTSSSRQ